MRTQGCDLRNSPFLCLLRKNRVRPKTEREKEKIKESRCGTHKKKRNRKLTKENDKGMLKSETHKRKCYQDTILRSILIIEGVAEAWP